MLMCEWDSLSCCFYFFFPFSLLEMSNFFLDDGKTCPYHISVLCNLICSFNLFVLQKNQTRVTKGSDLQVQLNLAQEDLRKAKEQIASIEKEKDQAINELKEAQRVAEEANEKLREALAAQKRAEEDSEIERFRVVELEQAGIEESQKKEEEWQKEIEAVRNQHALDVATLLSTTQELQKVKQELAAAIDVKDQALSHADDATKIAEIQAEKVEMLSGELTRMKSLLESKLENESKETNKFIMDLKSEIDHLKEKLEIVKTAEVKLIEKEAEIEQLNVDLEAAKIAEACACCLAEEWKSKAEELEQNVKDAKELERSAFESLESVKKQLEGSSDLLHNAEAEVHALREKVGLLEMTIRRQNEDLQESECQIEMAKLENSKMVEIVESLKSELEKIREEKAQAMNNEHLAVSNVQILLEEKSKLINELEKSREEEEKSKKAMESLASALHELSTESREGKEKLLSLQREHEKYKNQIEDLNVALKETNEKYELMLDDAKHEIDRLTNTIENSRADFQNSKIEWEQKELQLLDSRRQSEEELFCVKQEIDRLVNLQRKTEQEAITSKEEEAQLKDSLKEVESEVIYLQETLAAANSESMKLKENLLLKENELQSVTAENEDLHKRKAVSLKKVEELSKLLEDALAQKQTEEHKLLSVLHENEELHKSEAISVKKVEDLSNLLEETISQKKIEENKLQSIIQENEDLRKSEALSLKKVEELSKLLEETIGQKQTDEIGNLSDSEKDYDLLPKVVEFSEENGHGRDKSKQVLPPEHHEEPGKENLLEEENLLNDHTVEASAPELEDANGKTEDQERKEKGDDSVKVEFKMWESCTIEKKELSLGPETEQDLLGEEVDSKADCNESFDHINTLPSAEATEDGKVSPSKQEYQKKKKPLLRKFGSLLKKKGANQK